MNSSQILSITTFIYALSACIYIAALIFRKDDLNRSASWIAGTGIIGNIIGFGLRWIESYRLGVGHVPLSNLYESLIFFAMAIAVLYLFVEHYYDQKIFGAFVMPLAFLAMAYASLSPNISERIQPLLPALKSNWLIAHVVTCFIGYAAFAIASGLSLMYVIKPKTYEGQILTRIPENRVLDALIHQMVMFGFLFLTAGIITGAVWANSAWGRYWGWDPKETWSLITWFIYAALLHLRFMKGWRGKRIAVVSMIGFAAVLFTYFGVNYLPGLHSYGS